MATTCKHKIGLLSLRDCKAPAVTKCQSCARPVCEEHRRTLSSDGAERVLCPECYLEEASKSQISGSSEYERHKLYKATRYQPLYYGQSQRYGEEDYEYFDRESGAGFAAATVAGGMMDEMMESGDIMSPEDFQDS